MNNVKSPGTQIAPGASITRKASHMNDTTIPSEPAKPFVPSLPRVRAAIVQAAVYNPAAWVSIPEVKRLCPDLSTADIASDMGTMHDTGQASVIGWGESRLARFDGLVVVFPDGTATAIIDAENRPVTKLEGVLAEGFKRDPQVKTDE